MRLPAAIVLSCALTSNAYAGAWTNKAGEWQTFNTISYYSTDTYHDNQRVKRDQPQYSKAEWNPVVQYGISDSLTVGVDTYVQYLEQIGDNAELADTEIFLRQRLWDQDGLVISAQPLIKLPSLNEHDGAPRGGGDETDAELSLLGGYGFQFQGLDHFVDVGLAYRHRFEAPSDQIKLSGTLGIHVAEKWLIMPQAFMTWRMEDGSGAFLQSSAGDYDLLKAQLSTVYQWNDTTSVQLGAFSHVYTKNTGDGAGVLISLWKQF